MSKNIMAKQTCQSLQFLNLWLSLNYWESFKSQKILDFRWKWISKVQLLWVVVMEKNWAVSSSQFSERAFLFGPWAVGNFHERCACGTAQSCAGYSQHSRGRNAQCCCRLCTAPALCWAPHAAQLSLKSVSFTAYLIADVYNLIGFLCVSYNSAGFRNI